jgi:hypothetical protein
MGSASDKLFSLTILWRANAQLLDMVFYIRSDEPPFAISLPQCRQSRPIKNESIETPIGMNIKFPSPDHRVDGRKFGVLAIRDLSRLSHSFFERRLIRGADGEGFGGRSG